ncbi:hypothetical protein NGA_2052600, partial [Nannochloropsis gaditana CCMP526]|uniref:uncharacterized protein n=1 Tax=Nannochloropsis gaditana (strain CCMP526) TaxID=1093141 RepID=UPI00029F6C02
RRGARPPFPSHHLNQRFSKTRTRASKLLLTMGLSISQNGFINNLTYNSYTSLKKPTRDSSPRFPSWRRRKAVPPAVRKAWTMCPLKRSMARRFMYG